MFVFVSPSFDSSGSLCYVIVAFPGFVAYISSYGAFVFAITKTRLYNFDPLKPHFFIVKLGFTEVYIIFLISA